MKKLILSLIILSSMASTVQAASCTSGFSTYPSAQGTSKVGWCR